MGVWTKKPSISCLVLGKELCEWLVFFERNLIYSEQKRLLRFGEHVYCTLNKPYNLL